MTAIDVGVPLIEGKLKRQLKTMIVEAAPKEAVGIIWQNQAYPLTNTSSTPENTFEVSLRELRSLVELLDIPLDQLADEVYFWHSHPSGGVGPSRFDLTHRTPLKSHLVVTLVNGDIVATWY